MEARQNQLIAVRHVKRQVEQRLLHRANVVGVGVGYKHSQGAPTRELAVMVSVVDRRCSATWSVRYWPSVVLTPPMAITASSFGTAGPAWTGSALAGAAAASSVAQPTVTARRMILGKGTPRSISRPASCRS